jgi:CelD/BcsL family acetyltransferase involved in cellulose biosynthesis
MLQVQVTSNDSPRILAELIRSTQNEPGASPEIEAQARLVRETQAQAAQDRPSWTTLDTVDFQLLDPENDWTEV